ncbi:HAMP domain-containing histidine kinase [Shewanella canadensis]|uniref:histidine kinase n=1 Tax=Shewanella canadensis TaxID=271096 RepID=A0A3S0IR74_9GAMM|nr:HAMP domain-containing sensor histidine kinase [Shewanella canadensis]RTR37921.1 HAMP domain-containing histidine kinase [Shewanella canadensis]
MEKHVKHIIEGVSNAYGLDFFERLTIKLDQVIGADFTFIAQIDENKHQSKTITLVENGKLANNLIYSLTDTPCADVASNSVCCFPSKVCSLYPDDQFLIDLAIEAYVGTPLHDSKGKVMGIIVALYKAPIIKQESVITLFQIFSGRVAAEMERLEYERSLQRLNDSLDLKVQQRTEDLSKVITQLKQTQDQLVEADKMAALGKLIAGVAHEVNTPLGLTITTHSMMELELSRLDKKITQGQLSVDDMNQYLSKTGQALQLQGDTLIRAKKLIESFKRMAAEQHYLEVEKINIKDYYQKMLTTLKPLCRPKEVKVVLSSAEDIFIRTLPGLHAQIITNLVNNSILHGFNGLQDNIITIEIKQISADEIEVDFIDNGFGLSDNSVEHLFEPFYTTARDKGGTGLGLSIVYNLIVQRLYGAIKVQPSQRGLHLVYRFKADNSQLVEASNRQASNFGEREANSSS